MSSGCGGGGGSGGGPRLAERDAAPLIYLSNRVARLAASDPCTARRDVERLQAQAIRLVNSGRVPAPLKEDLLGGINDLATHPLACPPPAPVTTPAPAPSPATAPAPAARGHGKGHGKHKGEHGHGKHGHGGGDD